MDNNTYKKIQKLILLAGIVVFFLINTGFAYNLIKNTVSIFMPFITGICIAFVLSIPMLKIENFLQKYTNKKSRALSILLTILSFLTFLSIISYMIIPEITNSIQEISTSFPKFIDNAITYFEKQDNEFYILLANFGINFNDMMYNLSEFLKNTFISYGSSTFKSLFSATSSIFSSIVNIFLGIIFAIYILFSKESLIKQAKSLIQSIFKNEKSKKIIYFFEIVDNAFAKFITGQGLEAVILGLLFLISMSILNIPKPIPISAIIGIFSLIPIVGSTIAAIYGVISILIISPIKAVWFLILFLILQQIEGNLIYPKVVGKSVGLPGMWVLLAITIGGNVGGLFGMIVSVPIMSVIYILVSSFVKKSKIKSSK